LSPQEKIIRQKGRAKKQHPEQALGQHGRPVGCTFDSFDDVLSIPMDPNQSLIDLCSILLSGFNHLEKYESQREGLSHILWKITKVPNHQPDICSIYSSMIPS